MRHLWINFMKFKVPTNHSLNVGFFIFFFKSEFITPFGQSNVPMKLEFRRLCLHSLTLKCSLFKLILRMNNNALGISARKENTSAYTVNFSSERKMKQNLDKEWNKITNAGEAKSKNHFSESFKWVTCAGKYYLRKPKNGGFSLMNEVVCRRIRARKL